jgi:hypothetical protein
MALSNPDFAERPRTARNPLERVFGEEGLSTDIVLRPDELAALRKMTTESWLGVIRKVAPEAVDQFEQTGIEHYHELSHLLDHANIWTTNTRTFSAEVAAAIRSFSLFDMFDRECPGYGIASEMPPYGDLGRPRINWRLVRPGDGTDIGPIHADYWFEAVLDDWSDEPDDLVRIKIWIPIHLEQGVTGFAFSPGSHREHLPFERKKLPDGYVKPHFDEVNLTAPLQTLPTPCGTAVIFNYNLVHRGANSQRATRTRVSMEFTINAPRRTLEERFGNLDAFY